MHLLLRDGEVIFLNSSNFPTREAILSICKSTLSVPVRIPFHLSACKQDWLSYSGCVAIGEVVVARGKCPLGTVRGGVSTLHARMSWKLESNTPPLQWTRRRLMEARCHQQPQTTYQLKAQTKAQVQDYRSLEKIKTQVQDLKS